MRSQIDGPMRWLARVPMPIRVRYRRLLIACAIYQRGDKQPPGRSSIPPPSHTCSPRGQICLGYPFSGAPMLLSGHPSPDEDHRACGRLPRLSLALADDSGQTRVSCDTVFNCPSTSLACTLSLLSLIRVFCAFDRRCNPLSVPYLESVTKPPTSARRDHRTTNSGS
jgi:hypothetical protein